MARGDKDAADMLESSQVAVELAKMSRSFAEFGLDLSNFFTFSKTIDSNQFTAFSKIIVSNEISAVLMRMILRDEPS